MSGFHGLPTYRQVFGNTEVSVFADGVLVQTATGETFRIDKPRLVGAMNRASRDPIYPDWVVVVYRRSDGGLEHLRLGTDKGKSRELSNAIYRIIDGGFRKSFTTFRYAMTHKIDLRPRI